MDDCRGCKKAAAAVSCVQGLRHISLSYREKIQRSQVWS